MQEKRYQVLLYLFLAGMLSLHSVIAWDSIDLIRKGYPDFTIFYSGASIVRQGLGHHLYDEQTQYSAQKQFAADVSIRQGPLPYVHPPFETLLFIPFTGVSYPAAFVLWDVLNLIFLTMVVLLLRPALPVLRLASTGFWLLASLAFFPVFFALLQGQDVLLLVLLLAAVYLLLRQNNEIAAGLSLGLGVFRFQLVLPLVLILLYQKRSKAIFGFTIAAVVLVLASAAIVGGQGVFAYPHQVWHWEQTMQQRQTIVPIRMANLRGILDDLLIRLSSRWVSNLVIAVLSLALVFLAARKWSSKTGNRTDFDLGFALCIVVTVLVGYHTLAYDLSLLLLPMALTIQYLWRNQDMDRRSRRLLAVPLFLLFLSPLHAFLAMRDGHYNLFALVLLFWCWALSREIRRGSEKGVQEQLA